MPDNNVKNDNYDAEKEIMRINNVDVPKEKWGKNIDTLYRITDNIIHENDENKELYRDYKHLNLETVKRLLKKNIIDMKPSSILNKINKDFIKRKKNKILLISINLLFLKECKNNGIANFENYNLNKFDERMLAAFNRNNNIGESFIDSIVFPKRQNGLFRTEDIKIRKQIIPVLERLIDNVDKNEIGFFDAFLKKNNLSFFENTINSERLEQENDKIKEMFGIQSNDPLIQEQKDKLNDKLTIIQAMKDKFNEELSNMTPDMIEGNKNKLGNLQSNIMAEEDMVVHGAGFKHLGLFTSDV